MDLNTVRKDNDLHQCKMLLTEQQVLLSVIFPTEAKESLVPEESEERFAGGFLSQTSMQIQLSQHCRADVN